MELGIAAQPATVLEQRRIVGRDALEKSFDGLLDLGITGRSMPEQGSVVDQRAEQVENQVEVDVVAQIAALVSPLERLPDGGARWVEQGRHEFVPQLSVAGAVGEQGAEHVGRQPPEGGDEDLEALVEIAEGAPGVRRARRSETLSERSKDQPLT